MIRSLGAGRGFGGISYSAPSSGHPQGSYGKPAINSAGDGFARIRLTLEQFKAFAASFLANMAVFIRAVAEINPLLSKARIGSALVFVQIPVIT